MKICAEITLPREIGITGSRFEFIWMATAKRLIFIGCDKSPRCLLETVNIPQLQVGEILCKIRLAAICKSDLLTLGGHRAQKVPRYVINCSVLCYMMFCSFCTGIIRPTCIWSFLITALIFTLLHASVHFVDIVNSLRLLFPCDPCKKKKKILYQFAVNNNKWKLHDLEWFHLAVRVKEN